MPGKRAVRQHMRSFVAPKIPSTAPALGLSPGARAPSNAAALGFAYLERRSPLRRTRTAAK